MCKSNVKIRLLKRSCVKPGSTICPPVFGGEMEVAACSFPESKQIEGPRGPSKQYAAKVWIYALWSIPDLLPECQTCQHLQTLRICATADSKHVKETKLDQTASLNSVVHFSKPYFWCGQLMLSSFLKLLLFPTCPTTISKMSVPRTTISLRPIPLLPNLKL